MQIASQNFFLFFLPLTLLVYWKFVRNSRQRLWVLFLANFLFYLIANSEYLNIYPAILPFSILVFCSISTYFLARLEWFTVGIIFNLGALTFFKYWNFGASNINRIGQLITPEFSFPVISLIIPLGISYFVFKHIGYLVDVKQKRYPASNSLLTFLTYSSFFPQISAGPISSYQDTGEQLSHLQNTLNADTKYSALVHISVGLAKKLILADQLRFFLSSELATETGRLGGFIPAWIYGITFFMQLYFDFSGYTDIVLGIGLLFGVNLPANFNNPFLATNGADFWQRWHMSLSEWFRAYLFTPISRAFAKRWGPSRRVSSRVLANFITMGLIGFWHGAGWGFILWGVYSGFLMNVKIWAEKFKMRIPLLNNLYVARTTFFLANVLGIVFFLSPSYSFARNLLIDMSGYRGLGELEFLKSIILAPEIPILLAALFIAFSGRAEAVNLLPSRNKWMAVFVGILFAFSFMLLGESLSFAYIQF